MELLLLVALFVVGIVVFPVRDRLAGRRRRRMRAGGTVECRALLAAGDGPLRPGRLRAGAGELSWHGRRGSAPVDLRAARVLSAVAEPKGRRARPDDVELRLAAAAGEPVRLVLHEGDAGLVVRQLSTGGSDGPGPGDGDPGDDTGLPRLTEADVLPSADPAPVVMARLAPYAARQVGTESWEDPDEPAGSRPPRLLTRVLRALLWPAVGLALVLLLTAPWPYRWYVLQTAATATAPATSTGEEVISGPGPIPADVIVRFRDADGVEQTADVATTRALPEGASLSVRYAVDKPGWARVTGPGDGLDRGALLALIGALAALGWAGWRLLDAVAGTRAVRTALAAPARPVLGLLTADPMGDPLLLLASPVVSPVRLVAVPLLAPLPQGAAAALTAAGAASLHARGTVADDEAVVVELPGTAAGPAGTRLLLPAAPAFEADADTLLEVLDSAGALARYTDGRDGEREDPASGRPG